MHYLKVKDYPEWVKSFTRKKAERTRSRFRKSADIFTEVVSNKNKQLRSINKSDVRAYSTFLTKRLQQTKSTAAMYLNYLRTGLSKTKQVDSVIFIS